MSEIEFSELLFADPVSLGPTGGGSPVQPRRLEAWLEMLTGGRFEIGVGQVPATDGRLIVLPAALPEPVTEEDAGIFRIASLVQAGLVSLGLLEQRPFIARMHRDWLLRTAWTQLAGRAVLAHYARGLPGVARDWERIKSSQSASRLMVNLVEVPHSGLPEVFSDLLRHPPGAPDALSLMGEASRWRDRLASADLGPAPVPWYLGVLRPEWLLESRELDEDWQRGQKPLRLLRRAIERARGQKPLFEQVIRPTVEPSRREWRDGGWSTVRVVENEARGGPTSSWDRILASHQREARALQRRFAALRQEPRWVGGQLDGSEVDLDRALVALADIQAGQEPSRYLYRSFLRPPLPLAVHTLVDLSGSTTGAVLHAEQSAVVLFALALQSLGAPHAFTGFNGSDGVVRLHHLKGFEQSLDESARKRLGNLQAEGSTRLGAVIRHAAAGLRRRREPRRLLLLLSDGRPEARDYRGRVALTDSALAVREARRSGVQVHCISLDGRDTRWLRPIFGAHHLALRRVDELASRLPELFARLM